MKDFQQKRKKTKKQCQVFGWSKSNKFECKNTDGIVPLPTVVPQQIWNPRCRVQHRDCWCLCLHHQRPRRESVEVLVALLCGQNMLLRLPTCHLFPRIELLGADKRQDVSFSSANQHHFSNYSGNFCFFSLYTPVVGCPCLCKGGGRLCVRRCSQVSL